MQINNYAAAPRCSCYQRCSRNSVWACGSLLFLKLEVVLRSGWLVTYRPQQCGPHTLANLRGGRRDALDPWLDFFCDMNMHQVHLHPLGVLYGINPANYFPASLLAGLHICSKQTEEKVCPLQKIGKEGVIAIKTRAHNHQPPASSKRE